MNETGLRVLQRTNKSAERSKVDLIWGSREQAQSGKVAPIRRPYVHRTRIHCAISSRRTRTSPLLNLAFA
jgi:hypothetical protein